MTKPEELNVALLLADVAVALLLTDLTVAAVATRTPGSASRLLVSTELLADLVVAPPKDLASEKKPLGKAGTSRDLVVAPCMVVVAAVLAALEAAIFEDLASSTMATWPPDHSERQAEPGVLGVLSRRGGGACVGAISGWEAREDEGDRARVAKIRLEAKPLKKHGGKPLMVFP
ncbi:hypothetical protein PF008_g27065 [Phytophthora fragariae]|uniref:Uncharacterized protein n=2 Tax=Phytophthora fragariae TaxID=53985 RepID=A0A6G0QFZ0_9STRA|nr:hypothetical protein PF008_g27065 [Phytophthora fragariae]